MERPELPLLAYFILAILESNARIARIIQRHQHGLVILEEIRHLPEVFQLLRILIDDDLPETRRNGRFLVLGSASIDLFKQSSESLAGRISHLELRIPAETLRCWLTMLAHSQGGMLNAAQLARSLAIDGKTVARYFDLLVDLLLVRRLPPYHINIGKRLIKSPKVYIRDSGLVHAQLEKGFHHARDDLRPERSFLVYPGSERYPMGDDIEAIGVIDLMQKIAEQ